MRRLLALLLCAVMAAGVLVGCATEDTPHVPTGDGLDWAEGTNPVTPNSGEAEAPAPVVMAYYPDLTFNPYQCAEYTNRAMFPLLYQSLFVTNREYEVAPLLCESFTVSEDMRNYTFYVTPDARFADGEQLLGEDVTASLLAAMSSGYYVGRFTHVKSISNTRDGGVLVQLDTAYEDLPRLLDIPIVKKEQVSAATPIGSGPYVVRTVGGNTALYRNDSWWCDASLVINQAVIPLSAAVDTVDIRDQFEFFDVSLVCADPCSDFYAAYRCDYELWDCENGIFVYLGCNVESGVFANKEIRSALTYAVDRETLAAEYYRGFAQPTVLPAPPQSPYYNMLLASGYEFQSSRFAQAVTQAGVKGEKVLFLANSDDTLRLRAARAIGEMLTACGLQVEMVEKTTDEYYRALQMKEYHLYLGQTRLSPNMDLSEFFHEDGKISFGPMNDPTIYSMCLLALENSGNYTDLYESILKDGRLCPVLFRNYAIYANRGSVADLEPARDNLFYYDLGRTMEDAKKEEPAEPPAPETTAPPETIDPSETTAPDTTGE